jgi:hypothetical protein
MADLFSLLMGDDPSAQAQAEALSRLMKQKQGYGSILAMTGDRTLAPVGQQFAREGLAAPEQIAGAMNQRQGRQLQRQGMLQAQGNADRAYGLDLRQFGEASRHNKALEGAAGAKADADKRAASAKAAEDLRKEFQGGATYKNTQTIGESYKKIAGTSDSGAGDVSLIYSFMRMVDPGSTVREGEFATAANAGSIPDRVVGAYNRALSGEKLPPEVRKQFRDEAKRLLKAQADRYEETANPYRRLAQQAGVDPGDVVLDLGLAQMLAEQGGPVAGAPPVPARKTIGAKTYEKRADGWYEVD